jgi:hypothetical protein
VKRAGSRSALLLSVCFLLLTLAGCGDPLGSRNTVRFSGKLIDSRYSTSAISQSSDSAPTARNPLSSIDKLIALPLYGGRVAPATWLGMLETDISPDGSFSLPILRTDAEIETEWIFMLIDSVAPDMRDRVVKFVTLSAEAESLVVMPISEITGDIDYGEIDSGTDGDEAPSSNSYADNSTSFELTASQLVEIAQTDDAYKILKSSFINYDEDGRVDFNIGLTSHWTSGVVDDLRNKYSEAPSRMSYIGYDIQFGLPDDNHLYSYEEVAQRSTRISFFPPSEITNGIMTWGPDVPFANDGKRADGTLRWDCVSASNGLFCSDDDFVVSYPDEGAAVQTVRLGFPGGRRLTGVIPAGYWSLKREDTEIAVFDFGIASPFRNEDQNDPRVYIPDMKYETDGSGRLTRILLKWYVYESGAYEEIADLTVVQSSIRAYMITLADATGSTAALEFIRKSGSEFEITDFESDWFFGDTESDSHLVLESTAIDYHIVPGINYRFSWD